MRWINRRSVAAASILAVASLVVGRLALPGIVERHAVSTLKEDYDLDLLLEDLSLSLTGGTSTITGLRISADGNVLLECPSLTVEASVSRLLGGDLVVRAELDSPTVHVRVLPDGRTNVQHIVERIGEIQTATASGSPVADGSSDDEEQTIVVEHARVTGGRLLFQDHVSHPGQPLDREVRDVTARVERLQLAGESIDDGFADLRVSGELVSRRGPAYVSLVAWSDALGGWEGTAPAEPTFTVHAAVTGLDLSELPQYVGAAERTALGNDVMHLRLHAAVENGVIREGLAVGEVADGGAKLPLHFSGPLANPTFDKSSALLGVFSVPFLHLGKLGGAVVGVGEAIGMGAFNAVGDAGSGVIGGGEALFGGLKGLVEGVSEGDVAAAGTALAEGVVDTGKSLVGGVIGVAESLFGGGEDAVSRTVGGDLSDEERWVGYRDLHHRFQIASLAHRVEVAKRTEPDRVADLRAELERVSVAGPGGP